MKTKPCYRVLLVIGAVLAAVLVGGCGNLKKGELARVTKNGGQSPASIQREGDAAFNRAQNYKQQLNSDSSQ